MQRHWWEGGWSTLLVVLLGGAGIWVAGAAPHTTSGAPALRLLAASPPGAVAQPAAQDAPDASPPTVRLPAAVRRGVTLAVYGEHVLAEERTGYAPNFVLVNYYRSGFDSIGWHADDERDLGDAPAILSLSLGAERDFQFRHRDAFPRAGQPAPRPELQTITLPLRSGSLLIMRDPTNQHWKHQLPRRGGKKAVEIGARLNLTWRRIVVRST